MTDNLDVLALKSINCAKREHAPSSQALRILSLQMKPTPALATRAVAEHIVRRRDVTYVKFQQFKGISSAGQFEYRQCGYPSPLTALVEASILGQLAAVPDTAPQSCCYSYQWPRRGASEIFEYFYDGYRRRQRQIAAQLDRSSDDVVVVLDIRRFYDTVDLNRLLPLTQTKRIGPELRLALKKIVEAQAAATGAGLLAGPPSSHHLANVYLHSFNARMRSKWGKRYFRYVDDLAIVAKKSEVAAAIEETAAWLSEQGLTLNTLKTDDVTAAAWLDAEPALNEPAGENIGSIMERIRVFFARRPDHYSTAVAAMEARGLFLPLKDLLNTSRRPGYRAWLLAAGSRGLTAVRPAYLTDSVESVTRGALAARVHHLRNVDQLISLPIPTGGMARRWVVQRWRSQLAACIQLLDDGGLVRLIEQVPDIAELAPQLTVMKCLVARDFTLLLPFPGSAVRLFCSSWLNRLGPSRSPAVRLPQPSAPELESLATVAAYGLLRPLPPEWSGSLTRTQQMYLTFASGQSIAAEELMDRGDDQYGSELVAIGQVNYTYGDATDRLRVAENPSFDPFIFSHLSAG